MMATDYPHYLVADINPDLINLFKHIAFDCEKFISNSKGFFSGTNSAESYYNIRQDFNHSAETTDFWKAVFFLYLNRHGYRGLCRYNLSGHFNVPYGNYKIRIFLKVKYALLQKRLNAQRLSVPAMTKHWRCCRLVMLFIVIRHTMAHLAVITLPVLQKTISIIWRSF